MVASVASRLARDGEDWARLCESQQRVDPVETIMGELFPLCAALRFIGKRGPGLLRTQRFGIQGRPSWLWGVHSEIRRDPHGVVLVLGTWNYPLLLVGVQMAQALAAGNEVWLKPAVGCEAISERLAGAFYESGVPKSALRVLDSSAEAAVEAIDSGVDLIVLTGSASTGRKVLQRAAQTITPCIMELSGCDAVVFLPGADADRAASAIVFGLMFNGGATCIGPRRLIVERDHAEPILAPLCSLLRRQHPVCVHPAARESVARAVEQAIGEGAVDCLGTFDSETLRSNGTMAPVLLDRVKPDAAIASSDLFAPVLSLIRVDQISEAVDVVNACPYRLAASVFGPQREAKALAGLLKTGSVAVNDLIVTTADPRVPFGGRGDSGFGVTRGAEGLLAMTVPVVTGVRRGRWMPHLMLRRATDAQTLLGALQLLHARTMSQRVTGLRQIASAWRSSKTQQTQRRDDAAK